MQDSTFKSQLSRCGVRWQYGSGLLPGQQSETSTWRVDGKWDGSKGRGLIRSTSGTNAGWGQRLAECGVILDYTPELSAQGMSTRAIAPTVGVTQKTVVKDTQVIPQVSPEPESLDEYRQVKDDLSPDPEPESLDEYRIHGELGDSSGERDKEECRSCLGAPPKKPHIGLRLSLPRRAGWKRLPP